MVCKDVLSIIQTVGIIGALVVSVFVLILTRTDVVSRLRPYVFIHAFHTYQAFAKDIEPPNNILKIDYQFVIRCIGQSPAIIRDIQLEETLSTHPELLPPRKISFESNQIIYPGSDIRVTVPHIGTDVARKIHNKEDTYRAKITIVYSQLGKSKKFIYERNISYNPEVKTGGKIVLESIGRIT